MKYAKLLYIEKARKRKAEELRLQKSLFISKNTARSWLRTIQAKILSQQKLITNLKVANIYSNVRKKKMQHEMTFMSFLFYLLCVFNDVNDEENSKSNDFIDRVADQILGEKNYNH